MNMPVGVIKLSKVFEGHQLFCVGGCVRDSIIGVEPHDWDLATDVKPKDIITILKDNNIKYTTVGIEFGTVTAMVDGEEFEITTFRQESGYADNRHPDKIEWADTVEMDLARRDFTINAIAYNCHSIEYIDPFNGIRDLSNKVLRSVGEPDDRFTEDALRIVRALRFAIKYDLRIESGVAASIHKNVGLLNNISKERITDEFRKILTSGESVLNIFSEYYDVVCELVPELIPCVGFNQHNKFHNHDVYIHILHVVDNCEVPDFCIKLSALLHDIGKPDAFFTDENGQGHFYGHPKISADKVRVLLKNNFRVTSSEYDFICNLVEYHDLEPAETEKAMKRFLNKFGVDFVKKWLILRQADMDDHVNLSSGTHIYTTKNYRAILDDILTADSCFKLKDLVVNGDDVVNVLNIKPSKQVGVVLNTLLDEVIDGKVPNERDVLLDEIKRLGGDGVE